MHGWRTRNPRWKNIIKEREEKGGGKKRKKEINKENEGKEWQPQLAIHAKRQTHGDTTDSSLQRHRDTMRSRLHYEVAALWRHHEFTTAMTASSLTSRWCCKFMATQDRDSLSRNCIFLKRAKSSFGPFWVDEKLDQNQSMDGFRIRPDIFSIGIQRQVFRLLCNLSSTYHSKQGINDGINILNWCGNSQVRLLCTPWSVWSFGDLAVY